jgi:hypothetical protein
VANDSLLSTLEQTLRQTKAMRSRLASRLSELEAEVEALRSEIREIDNLISQTESSMWRLLSGTAPTGTGIGATSEYDGGAEKHSRLEPMEARVELAGRMMAPPIRPGIEATSDRFRDRTIPQATTVLLREAGEPLHVNEIYNRLLEGGFNFTGNNPTISIAVSLNRNGRFRKVAPGTFDLVMRDAAQAS